MDRNSRSLVMSGKSLAERYEVYATQQANLIKAELICEAEKTYCQNLSLSSVKKSIVYACLHGMKEIAAVNLPLTQSWMHALHVVKLA